MSDQMKERLMWVVDQVVAGNGCLQTGHSTMVDEGGCDVWDNDNGRVVLNGEFWDWKRFCDDCECEGERRGVCEEWWWSEWWEGCVLWNAVFEFWGMTRVSSFESEE